MTAASQNENANCSTMSEFCTPVIIISNQLIFKDRTENMLIFLAVISTAHSQLSSSGVSSRSYDDYYQDYYEDQATALSGTAPAAIDLSLLVVPFFLLLGMFFLFPTYVTIASVKRMALSREITDTNIIENIGKWLYE